MGFKELYTSTSILASKEGLKNDKGEIVANPDKDKIILGEGEFALCNLIQSLINQIRKSGK